MRRARRLVLAPILSLTLLLTAAASPQTPAPAHAQLAAGPMVGYSTMREVALWVQTRGSAEVQFAYWERGAPETRAVTALQPTRSADAFTATLVADQVAPGKHYDYELLIDGEAVPLPYPARFQTQTLWQWRTDPPEFTALVASCFYVNEPEVDRPGTPYGAGFEILEHAVAAQPDLMLWTGDNTYLREVDWNSRTGILHRYSHTRAYPGLQPLLASTHHYATWDDHDYGPNNADRGWWGKELTREAFELFWANPSYGLPDAPGVTTRAVWADAEFFLLDNRSHRTPNDRVATERVMLGDTQLQWLIDNLVSSTATFRFVIVGNQFVNDNADFENYATYPEERQRVLEALAAERIPGVIFLTGDRHRTELSVLPREGLYPLHDFTVSPLTAGTYSGTPEPNSYRDTETVVQDRNFALLHFAGPRTDRVLTVRVIDVDGTERWRRQIRAQDLYEGTR